MKKYFFYLFLCTILIVTVTSGQVKLTVNVIPPPSTPPDAVLYITGNHPLAGEWEAGKVPMTKQGDSLWTIDLSLPQKFRFEFKITRGNWTAEAIYRQNEVPSNTAVTLNADTTVTLQPIFWSDSGFVLTGSVTGTVYYHRELKGEGLDYARDLIVWLPPSYATDTLKRYPVLYMHDGQNIFDPKTSFSRYDWRVDEVADSLIKTGLMEEIIVVGVYNSPDRRLEYNISEKGEAYHSFLIDVVKPMVDSVYRTLPGVEHTATMGSSMGGLVSFLLTWEHPEVFSRAGCLAPLFTGKLIDDVRDYDGPEKNIRLYIDMGGKGVDVELLPGFEKMIPVLKEKGFKEGENLKVFSDSTADHNERAWAVRVWRPLLFLFGTHKVR